MTDLRLGRLLRVGSGGRSCAGTIAWAVRPSIAATAATGQKADERNACHAARDTAPSPSQAATRPTTGTRLTSISRSVPSSAGAYGLSDAPGPPRRSTLSPSHTPAAM